VAAFDDFLLREIERFGKALARVMKAREDGDLEAAQQGIDDGLRALVGLSVQTLARMAPDAVRPLLADRERLEVDRTVAVALLLAESATLQRDPGEAHQHRLAATGLLALAASESELDAPLAERLEELARSVHLTALDGPTLGRLLAWFEARDRFDRAEDSLFAWLGKSGEHAAAHAAGLALFERLWALPDARLQAGGLSSQDVLDGLADLQAQAAAHGGSA